MTPLGLALKLYGRDHVICDILESNFHTLEFVHAALAGNRRIVKGETIIY